VTDRNTKQTAAQLFAVLWVELVTMLGTVAAATLVRRAVKLACVRNTELCRLSIEREGFHYRYALPTEWEKRQAPDVPALSDLVVSGLAPLLRQFTGQIVLRRLRQNPELSALRLPGLENR
jgi:hypothetical protein